MANVITKDDNANVNPSGDHDGKAVADPSTATVLSTTVTPHNYNGFELTTTGASADDDTTHWQTWTSQDVLKWIGNRLENKLGNEQEYQQVVEQFMTQFEGQRINGSTLADIKEKPNLFEKFKGHFDCKHAGIWIAVESATWKMSKHKLTHYLPSS